jgi:hypothetical protein
MFQRLRKSSQVPELSPPADEIGAAERTSRLVLEWREDARRVGRAYQAWCAADRRNRGRAYLSFLDALTREEQAACRLEHGFGHAGLGSR